MLLLGYAVCTIWASRQGAAFGDASLLAMGVAAAIAAGSMLTICLMEASRSSNAVSIRHVLASRGAFLRSIPDAVMAAILGVAALVGFVVLMNLKAISPLLPGAVSEAWIVVTDIRTARTHRPMCQRTAIVRVDSERDTVRLCLETRFGVSVPLDGARVGKVFRVRIRNTPLYRVVEGVSTVSG